MVFESDAVPKHCVSYLIVPLYKRKWEITKCKCYRSISLLSVVKKLYSLILVDRVRKGTKSLTNEQQVGIR